MSRPRARANHKHDWEPFGVHCDKCGRHPAVRCTDTECAQHAHPIDITKYADPRILEAKMAEKREELHAAADRTRAAYRAWQQLSDHQDALGTGLRTLEGLYREVMTAHG